MYSTADWTITPRPMYPADGRKIFDIYTQPMELRETIKKDLGEFPFPTFWGPMAGIQSSQWIADSARWVERKHRPDLSLIYLPYLDYDLQKFGPSSTQAAHAAEAMDGLLCDLVDFLEREGVTPVVLSEYGHFRRIPQHCPQPPLPGTGLDHRQTGNGYGNAGTAAPPAPLPWRITRLPISTSMILP